MKVQDTASQAKGRKEALGSEGVGRGVTRTRTWTDVTVDDVMTRGVATVSLEQQLRHARHIMDTMGVRHVVVTDEQDQVAGMISERDILRALASEHRPSSPVSTVMTHRVCSVTPGTPLAEALHLMLTRKIGALPVEDENERAVGIVTAFDMLWLLERVVSGRTPRGLVPDF